MTLTASYSTNFLPNMSFKRMMILSSKVENDVEETEGLLSLLDLPELALEIILEKLPPVELSTMAKVCCSLRDKCRSDYFWEKHMKQKWGKVIGPTAQKELQWHLALRKGTSNLKQAKENNFQRILTLIRTFSWGKPMVDLESYQKQKSYCLPADSIMSWYLALENGRFWFPAQVYNRENGHLGFLLSCYDAELSYDAQNNTFHARYPPHGRRAVAIEDEVPWERIRAPPVNTKPHDLHISDCLNDLCPGDHIEIQWRKNKEFPYGWWYAVVGHQESCDGNKTFCLCHKSDTVVLEFNQYASGSRWRQTVIDRLDHREEGNEAEGFYGGIRKITNKDEISTWKSIFPTEKLE